MIILTESHLKPEVLDAEINIDSFQLLRCDREHRKNGGVLAYISNKHPTKPILNYSNAFCSCLGFEVPSFNVIFFIVYRPPHCPTSDFTITIEKMRNAITTLGSPTPRILLMGDFNFPRINWNTKMIDSGGTKIEQDQAKLLLNFHL